MTKLQYLSWRLRKNDLWKLSPTKVIRIIQIANQKGLITRDEFEELEHITVNLDSMDLLVLDFLDNPYATLIREDLIQMKHYEESCYSLFVLTFPFLKNDEELIKASISKLFQKGLITIDFNEFRIKTLIENAEIYFTSPLGRKFIYLVKRQLSYS